MLPLSILTLVLLGGFVFASRWYPTRYHAVRSDGYRLVFTSAVIGVIFLFVATVLTSVGIDAPGGSWINKHWHQIVPVDHSGKAALAFLFGLSLWWPLNLLSKWSRLRFLGQDAAIRREIERKQNPLEVLLAEAMDSRSLVSVTVKNGKVYIGRVRTTFNPAFGMQSISLMLSRSGHRDKETQQMMLDVDYDKTHSAVRQHLIDRFREEVLEASKRNPEASRDEWIDVARRTVSEEPEARNYEIVLPVSEIQSINMFDMKIYEQFFAPEKDAATAGD